MLNRQLFNENAKLSIWRTDEKLQQQSLFTYSWLSNPLLLLAVSVTLALQLIVIYAPFFNTVFHTMSLRLEELVFALVRHWLLY